MKTGWIYFCLCLAVFVLVFFIFPEVNIALLKFIGKEHLTFINTEMLGQFAMDFKWSLIYVLPIVASYVGYRLRLYKGWTGKILFHSLVLAGIFFVILYFKFLCFKLGSFATRDYPSTIGIDSIKIFEGALITTGIVMLAFYVANKWKESYKSSASDLLDFPETSQ